MVSHHIPPTLAISRVDLAHHLPHHHFVARCSGHQRVGSAGNRCTTATWGPDTPWEGWGHSEWFIGRPWDFLVDSSVVNSGWIRLNIWIIVVGSMVKYMVNDGWLLGIITNNNKIFGVWSILHFPQYWDGWLTTSYSLEGWNHQPDSLSRFNDHYWYMWRLS